MKSPGRTALRRYRLPRIGTARLPTLSITPSAIGYRFSRSRRVGFHGGVEAEHEGIIRAGARYGGGMACTTVPKIVLTLNHASGAGYYAMAGQASIRISHLAGRPRGSA